MIVIENATYHSAPVSLTLEGVGIHGLLFANAAEKSGWMDLLAGCGMPQEGEILLQRKDTLLPIHTQKKHVGYVPSSLPLYEDMTVAEFLAFVGEAKGVAPDKRERQIKEAVDLLGLQKSLNRLIATLSATHRRRIAIAQALLGNPTVILMDDPFAGANAEQKRDLEALLEMLGRHKPIVLGAIAPDILSLCGNVTVIDAQGIRFSGEAAQLLSALSADGSKAVTAQSVAAYFGFADEDEEVEE